VRRLGIIAIALSAIALGAIQVLSTLALRDAAQSGSWVRLVPAEAAARVDALDPRFPVPIALRIVIARQALARGDLAVAVRQIDALPPSRDRAELNGMLSERRGDNAAAVRAFLEAGDVDAVERHVAAEQKAGNLSAALRLQREMIARLHADPTSSGALPEAYYQLGLLEQSYAYTLPIDDRSQYQRQSLEAYESAVSLAPLAERYLIAAGNEELNLGDNERAELYFQRTREVAPTSAAAWAGSGDVAYRRGSIAQACADLAEARKLSPTMPAVRRLSAELAGC